MSRPSFAELLAEIRAAPDYAGQVVHVEERPGREPIWGELRRPFPKPISEALQQLGIEHLYRHQATAINHLRDRQHTVIVTPTASGKSLCYNLPVVEALLDRPEGKALYLFPTKALAQDQMRGLRRLADTEPELRARVRCGTYDGDTPVTARRKLRNEGNVILTNPDMLHKGILPYHSRWGGFFANLEHIVVDEIHSYRGIFGSNVANVLRRLNRICRHYGSRPTYVCCSATIANPKQLAERLAGVSMTLVDDDGSPSGPKRFVLWNPPRMEGAGLGRRSSNEEAHALLVALLRSGAQTIVFTRTRIVAELLYRYASESLGRLSPALADVIRAYRAGYLPEERREIERQLFSGELRGVISTNALELGIDVGGLDAAVLVGYPGSIASTWQQAGRAGRGEEESLVVLVAYDEPIDQYLMRTPEYLFGRSPEHAVIDPENPYILAGHLRCAAFELPLREEDGEWFGDQTLPIASILGDLGQMREIDGAWYWSTTDYPAAEMGLRTTSDSTFAIMDKSRGNEVIGTVDAISAPETVYPGGVYLHDGDTYLVRDLDLEARAAYVERAEVDYYTQAMLDSAIRAGELRAEKQWAGGRLCFGEATVTWRTTAFKKVKFYSQESIGWSRLDLPAQHLETSACWLVVPRETLTATAAQGFKTMEGLAGIRNVAVNMLPLLAMCDRLDVGGIVDSSNLGSPTLFLYDRYLGGLGFAEKGYELFGALMRQCLATIEDCPCDDGCPSCVGLPATQPAQQMDPDLGRGYPIPDKQAALFIVRHLLDRESSAPTQPVGAQEAAPVEGRRPEAKAPSAVSTAEQVAHRLSRRRQPRTGL